MKYKTGTRGICESPKGHGSRAEEAVHSDTGSQICFTERW